MDRQNIDNRLQQIKVNNRYITKGFKYSIIAIAIGFVTVIALFIIMMVWGIISNVEVIPEEVSNVWFGVAVLYTTLFAPFCIITAIISVIVQMNKGTKQIIDIVRAGLNMRLLQPMILINTKSLAQFNSFEEGSIKKYFLENENILLNQVTIYNNNLQSIRNIETNILNTLDYFIANNIPIYKYDVNMIYKLYHEINSKKLTSIIIKVEYKTPAGRNYYHKEWEINAINLVNILNQIQIEKERIQMEEEARRSRQNNQAVNRDSKKELELIKALSLFMLEIPFTKTELKSQRNRLIKSFHTDSSNTDNVAYAVKINNAYELLLKYATE